jgi:lysophospholipase L1-like esterase
MAIHVEILLMSSCIKSSELQTQGLLLDIIFLFGGTNDVHREISPKEANRQKLGRHEYMTRILF